LLSPLYGYSDFTFEHSLKPGSSIECSLGIIGLGANYDNNQKGVSMRFGYKFIKNPDFYLKGMRYAHILKGAYFRPELAFSFYNKDVVHYDDWIFNSYTKNETIFSGALLCIVGNQWVFNDRILVDLYAGVGYGFSTYDEFDLQYGFSTGSSDSQIALSAGFRIGFLLY
jgi:hypothetical protein